MADLKTTYKDDLLDTSVNEKRKYNMIQNADGTVSFEDVTTYSQIGDSFGAADINATNKKVNEVNSNLSDCIDDICAIKTYSSDEIIVGTWFGKPLYRKSYYSTETKPTSGATSIIIDTNINSVNAQLIHSNGFFTDSLESGQAINSFGGSTSYYTRLILQANGLNFMVVWANEHIKGYAITVEYIKI